MKGQGGPGHAQGTLSGTVPTDEATGMDKDAARNPTDLVQGLIPKTPPWLWQGSLLWNEWSSLGTHCTRHCPAWSV